MVEQPSRPVYLSLIRFNFPLAAIISICHRISGIVLLLGFPYVVWQWHEALLDPNEYSLLLFEIQRTEGKAILTLFITALLFHFLAGLRHIAMDFGLFETRTGGLLSSSLVLLLSLAGLAAMAYFFFFPY